MTDQALDGSVGTPTGLLGHDASIPGKVTPTQAKTLLGLGTMATQAASAVAISGGTVTGITDLVVADGGTGASTLTGVLKGNGTSPFTAATEGTDYWKPGGTDVAVADGGTGSSTASGARTNLGLGTVATQDANNVTISGGAITGITDLAVVDGGTGSSTAANARTALGLVIGTNVFTQRTITGTSGVFTWTNGDGVSGAPSLAFSAKRVIAQNMRFVPPQTLGATPGVVSGTSAPVESFQCWDFDPSTIWYVDVFGVMSGILPASTGCTLKFVTVSGATSGNYIFNAAFRRLTAVDWDTTAFTYTTNAQAATVATSGTAGTPTAVSIAFTTGTQMNSVVAGDAFILRIWRDATNGSDTVNSNTIRLLEASLYIEEA